jgi:hypothetical protein
MTHGREAVTLPLLFLTVVLLGGVRIADRIVLLPPPLVALVLSVMLFGALIRCGVLVPGRLMSESRPLLANVNGLVVMCCVFAASAQAFSVATPDAGLPHVLFNVLFLGMLANTLAASAGRAQLLRSLLVIFGFAFTLKFIVLAALSNPAGGAVKRILLALFEGVTLGAFTQEVLHPASGYLAFFTLLLFVGGLALLPSSRSRAYAGLADRRYLDQDSLESGR